MTTPNEPTRPSEPSGATPEPQGVWERIAAFADGELDAEQADAMARKAADCTDTANCAEHQRQLRKLLSGCMDCKKTMRCPDELRRCLEDLAKQHDGVGAKDLDRLANIGELADRAGAGPVPFEPPATPTALANSASVNRSGSFSIAPFLRWGLAAALLLAVIGGFYAFNGTPGTGNSDVPLVNASMTPESFAHQRLNGIINRHVRCSTGQSSPLNIEDFSTVPQVLAPQVAGQVLALGNSAADAPTLPVQLDLEQAGLQIRLAGRCVAPGPNAMHLIYDATALDPEAQTGEAPASVSLWIKAYHADADPMCTPGQTEVLTDDGAAHPVMLWRDDRFMYVLVGDAIEHVTKAQETLLAGAI
ncbi:MAG: hypothetical protein AAGF84_12550 [Planctomycetota bacterium]